MRTAAATICGGAALLFAAAGIGACTSAPPRPGTSASSRPAVAPYAMGWIARDLTLPGPISLVVTPSHVVLVGGRGPVVARDLADGREAWTQAAELPVDAPLATGDGLVFVVSSGVVRAIDDATGRIAWRHPAAPGGAPLWAPGWLLVSSRDGLDALRAADGSSVWTAATGSPARSIAIDGARLFAALEDRRLISLDLQTGALLWEKGLDVRPGPILTAHDRIFFGGADAALYALSQKDGERVWAFPVRAPMLDAAPATDGPHVLVASFDNSVRALNVDSGALEWRLPLTGRPSGQLLVQPGHLVVAMANGDLALCLRGGNEAGRIPAPAASAGGSPLSPRLEGLDAADGQMLFRVTTTAAGRTLAMYRRAVALPLSPLQHSLGKPVTFRAPGPGPGRR